VIRRAGKWEDAGLRFVTSMAFARPLRVARNRRDSEHVAVEVGGERGTSRAQQCSAEQKRHDLLVQVEQASDRLAVCSCKQD
jgi:hypothetical protein